MTTQNIVTAITSQGYAFGKPKDSSTPFLAKMRNPLRIDSDISKMDFAAFPQHIVLEENEAKEVEKVVQMKLMSVPRALEQGLNTNVANYFEMSL